MSNMTETFGGSPPLLPADERPFVSEVRIRNFRSIAGCDVRLARLTVLVGRNAAGKSNFLDALRFVADALRTSLDQAIKSRGGLDAVRRRSTGHPRNFSIRLKLLLPSHSTCEYEFEIAAETGGGFAVKRETLAIRSLDGGEIASYEVEHGQVAKSSQPMMPRGAADRLYLVAASGLPEFRPVYDALLAMGFYHFNPAEMKELQSPDAGDILRRDGANLPSVIGRLRADAGAEFELIKDFLRTIVPGIEDVDRVPLGPRETLEFRTQVAGAARPWRFYASNMSDGTLRALGALVAVTQLTKSATPVTLIGIEEPETALHPAAAGALVDALRGATRHTQVLITTHSPDLLDEIRPPEEQLLVVQSIAGRTEIAPPDDAALNAIQAHLYTSGELLRMDQLGPNRADVQRQLMLFGTPEEPE